MRWLIARRAVAAARACPKSSPPSSSTPRQHGPTIRKRDETHRMAEANKAFSLPLVTIAHTLYGTLDLERPKHRHHCPHRCGKTTTTERILYYTVPTRSAKFTRWPRWTGWTGARARHHHHGCRHNGRVEGHRINIIDTSCADFTVEVERPLRVLDGGGRLRSLASSPSQKPSGARPTNTASRASASSTR